MATLKRTKATTATRPPMKGKRMAAASTRTVKRKGKKIAATHT